MIQHLNEQGMTEEEVKRTIMNNRRTRAVCMWEIRQGEIIEDWRRSHPGKFQYSGYYTACIETNKPGGMRDRIEKLYGLRRKII